MNNIITRQLIISATTNVLKKKSFEELTVKDICKECGISRQLFYYYYKDKYDLVNSTYKHDVDEIIELYSLDTSWKNIAFHVLYYMKSNQVFYTKAFAYRGQNSFYDFFNQYSYDLIKKMMDYKNLSAQYDGASMKSLQFYANACVMTTHQWALGDMNVDPSEIADMISDNIPNSLTLFFKR